MNEFSGDLIASLTEATEFARAGAALVRVTRIKVQDAQANCSSDSPTDIQTTDLPGEVG